MEKTTMARLFDEFRNWLRPTDSGEDITLAPAAPDHPDRRRRAPSWSTTKTASASSS
jgi:hypothetical protein